ncbi:MAG: hypothetical protein II232_03735, partial [Spirochaetaceae bacterium]|nr:hypothetical protein [Spirochaetaceae bacterium]
GSVVNLAQDESEIFSMPATNIQKYSKSYENNLKDEPTNAEINNSLGMCYLKMGFYEKALEKFNVAIEQDFNNSETYLFAAICVLAGRKENLIGYLNNLKSPYKIS